MSEILENNISYIRKYNPALAGKILSLQEFQKTFEVNTNFSQEYNLVIDGIPVHSLTGAEQEAKCSFEQLSHNFANSIHIIYGLGLGYLYDVYSQNTLGSIIVYEPDIELLRYVFEIVDFSNEFSKNRTYIVSDSSEFQEIFSNIYRYKSSVSFSTIDYYKHNNPALYEQVRSDVQKTYGLVSHNFSFQVNEMPKFFESTLQALDKKLTAPLLNDCKNALKDKPALIVSAGPSLASNIEYIKKYRDNFVIFCVGTALKILLNNGIVPDFLNIIEKTDTLIHYSFPQTKDMMLVCESYTNKDVLGKDYKKIFLTGSDEIETSRWFLEKRNSQNAYFETKGTVAYHAIYSAYTLGCNPIVLIGQDLAYSNGDCYAKGTFYEDLKCTYDENLKKFTIAPVNFEKFRDAYFNKMQYSEEIRTHVVNEFLEKENANLKTVVGQNGEQLPTSAAYALFIDYIADFGKRYGDKVKLFNCSKGGAQIDNFENLDLPAVAQNYASNKLDRDELLDSLNTVNSVSFSEIIKSLNHDVKVIGELSPFFEKGIRLVKKLQKELDMKNIYTDKAMDCLDDTVNLYIEISNKYLSKERCLIPSCSKVVSELAYLIKEYRIKPNKEYAQELCEKLDEFYKETPENLEKVKTSLTDTVNILEKENESCLAKS